MNEKTGNLVKMEYDFDTARNLEIYLPKLDNWYREHLVNLDHLMVDEGLMVKILKETFINMELIKK